MNKGKADSGENEKEGQPCRRNHHAGIIKVVSEQRNGHVFTYDMCYIDKNRARDACTKGLEGLTTASCDRNENLGGERNTRSAQAVLREVLRLICVLQVEEKDP